MVPVTMPFSEYGSRATPFLEVWFQRNPYVFRVWFQSNSFVSILSDLSVSEVWFQSNLSVLGVRHGSRTTFTATEEKHNPTINNFTTINTSFLLIWSVPACWHSILLATKPGLLFPLPISYKNSRHQRKKKLQILMRKSKKKLDVKGT